MKNSALIISLLISILYTGSSSTYAQETSDIPKEQFGWVNAGIGTSSAGLSGSINFSYQIEKNLISIRSIYNAEFKIFGPSPSETV